MSSFTIFTGALSAYDCTGAERSTVMAKGTFGRPRSWFLPGTTNSGDVAGECRSRVEVVEIDVIVEDAADS